MHSQRSKIDFSFKFGDSFTFFKGQIVIKNNGKFRVSFQYFIFELLMVLQTSLSLIVTGIFAVEIAFFILVLLGFLVASVASDSWPPGLLKWQRCTAISAEYYRFALAHRPLPSLLVCLSRIGLDFCLAEFCFKKHVLQRTGLPGVGLNGKVHTALQRSQTAGNPFSNNEKHSP
jgi:hypothetical protein